MIRYILLISIQTICCWGGGSFVPVKRTASTLVPTQ